MNRYSAVGGVSPTYWAEGGISTDGRLAYLYDETGADRVGYDSGGSSDWANRDALGQTVTRVTYLSGGTDSLLSLPRLVLGIHPQSAE